MGLLAAAYVLITASAIFALAMIFIWTAKSYSAIAACLVLSLLTLAIALVFLFSAKRKGRVPKAAETTLDNDPLAKYIPESLRSNPAVEDILEKIAENPVAATAGAVTLGMLLSRDFLGD